MNKTCSSCIYSDSAPGFCDLFEEDFEGNEDFAEECRAFDHK